MSAKESNEKKLPASLWHYTTAEGVKGILESEAVHCTNIFFLNDAEEFRHGVNLQLERLETLSASEKDPAFKEHLQILRTYLQTVSSRPNIAATYTFSLSESRDQLSQWRAYGAGEGGYAIEFDGNALETLARPQQGVVMPCFYDQINRGSMLSAFDRLCEEVSRNREKEVGNFKTLGQLAEMSKRLLQLSQVHASVLKNPYFDEEKEFRLIRRINDDDASLVRYRVKGSSLVPYVEVKVSSENELGPSPIRSVMVGPARHKELNIRGLDALLRTRNLHKTVEVHASDSPYRVL